LKKKVRKQRVLRDGKEETIITEDIQLIQDNGEPDELNSPIQNIVNQFIRGTDIHSNNSDE
jgi:hypothetical protein